MANIVNAVLYDTFDLFDAAAAAITGKTNSDFTSSAYLLATPATTATLTVSEIGSGTYRIAFTPSVAGTWGAHVAYSSGGVVRTFSATYDVALTATVTVEAVASATNVGLSLTLADLRRRVADRLGDWTQLTATSNGTATTIIDALNVNAGAENANGRWVMAASGTAGNLGRTARVTATTDNTSTLTITPAFPASTAAGDVFDLFNFRGIGWSPTQYKNAINNAINDAYPLGLIELQADVTGFSSDPPGTVTVPATMREVYAVEYVDGDGNRLRTLSAGASNGYGWSVDAANGELAITGWPASAANGLTLRLYGYGRQETLSAETDTCALNAEYIVARACYHLTLGKIGSDSSYGQMVNVFLNESQRLRTRIRTVRKPGTRLARAI